MCAQRYSLLYNNVITFDFIVIATVRKFELMSYLPMNSDRVLEINFKSNFDKELCAHRRSKRPFVFDALI